MKNFKLPSAYTIVVIALLITAALTYFIPVSVYDSEASQVVVGATFDSNGNIVHGVGTQPAGLWDVLKAPILGFQQASSVGIALLIAGGFLAVLNHVGALEAGIGKLITKFQGSVLIAMMMMIFAILGTVFGFAEEIPAFAIVIIPMFVLAGYDVMTGLGVLFIGAAAGGMASIVNPFSTGAAVSVIGNDNLSLGSGIILRMIIFIVLYAIATFLMIRYANSVKEDPKNSILYGVEGVKTLTDNARQDLELTRGRLISIFMFIGVVVALILGYVPWSEFYIGATNMFDIVNAPLIALSNVPVLGVLLGIGNVTPLGYWFFDEFSFVFLIGAILLKFINKIPEKEFVNIFVNGAKDMLGVVLVLSIARGISVIMGSRTSGISVTFVYWISSVLGGAPVWAFAVFAVLAFASIGLFLQSSSGVAGISMPILGAVAYALFAATAIGGEGGQIILISAFTLGLSFTGWLYPSAIVLGTLEIVNVPYTHHLKFTLKFLVPMLIAGTFIIAIAPYIGLI